MVEFISYDGSYPALCAGTLAIEVDGEVYELRNILASGGYVCIDDEGEEYADEGPWSLEYGLPVELMPYEEEILRVVNDNVPFGCCGGCI